MEIGIENTGSGLFSFLKLANKCCNHQKVNCQEGDSHISKRTIEIDVNPSYGTSKYYNQNEC